ncbi:hypothetical protein HU200_067321 [Digitaria exilis]|uniref:Uncharacterized protein n=1 Tax=Digitaria exilis TaxID=1010633 RepID=A0A835DSG6_9POAL|nr:hypothetical protein HU200_067321 [Digitaria exilis]
MPWFPAVPPALSAADGEARPPFKKRTAGLPKLLHKLLIKVLRLRPASASPELYGYRVGGGADEECCYYYSYGGSSWAGVLSSIPEEDDSSEEEGTPDVAVVPVNGVLRKAKSERFVVGSPDSATVVHVEVLL